MVEQGGNPGIFTVFQLLSSLSYRASYIGRLHSLSVFESAGHEVPGLCVVTAKLVCFGVEEVRGFQVELCVQCLAWQQSTAASARRL